MDGIEYLNNGEWNNKENLLLSTTTTGNDIHNQ